MVGGEVAEEAARGGEILVRAKGRRYLAEDYADITVVSRPDGSRVTLGQLAELSDGFPDSDLMVGFMGKPAMFVDVYRVADQNALTVAKTVKGHLEEFSTISPAANEIGIPSVTQNANRRFMNTPSSTITSTTPMATDPSVRGLKRFSGDAVPGPRCR